MTFAIGCGCGFVAGFLVGLRYAFRCFREKADELFGSPDEAS